MPWTGMFRPIGQEMLTFAERTILLLGYSAARAHYVQA